MPDKSHCVAVGTQKNCDLQTITRSTAMLHPFDFPVQTCPGCGRRNRVAPHSLLREKPLCAECGEPLDDPYWIDNPHWGSANVSFAEDQSCRGTDHPIETCAECGQRNRILPHSPNYKPLCGQCGGELNDPLLARNEEWISDGKSMTVTKLPFKLLPPGSWTISDVIAHYQHQAKSSQAEWSGGDFQWVRLQKISTLRPDRCWVGEDLWSGYNVFMFPFSRKAVFESLFEGNATYIISGDWQVIGRNTKRDLRKLFPRQYVKVVHKGDWLKRIKHCL